jgi:glycosyltransferase involved in cell wall biosynthesis
VLTERSSRGAAATESSTTDPPSRSAQSVVHVTSPAKYGGLETVIRLLASNQRRAGHAVCVALLGVDPSNAEHPLAVALAAHDVTVEFIPRGRFPYGAERDQLRTICRRVGATVLHTHGSRPDVVASPAGRALAIATVSTIHGITGDGIKNAIMHALEWRALRRVSGVIAVSRPLLGALQERGISAEQLTLIPNAFGSTKEPLPRPDARRAIGAEDGEYVLGWVGRLSREKGADVLIDALAHVKTSRPTVVFIGDGPELPALRQRARERGVDSQVRWLGSVPDAAPMFSGFDAFVLSSRSEGTPMCLFEAMHAGVPSIVTAVGGVPDVVSEREAVVIPPEQPIALASAIDRLIADAPGARLRAEAARRRLQDVYDVDSWVRSHEQLYRNLTAPSSGARDRIPN